jgi:hypothetical protein
MIPVLLAFFFSFRSSMELDHQGTFIIVYIQQNRACAGVAIHG